MRHGVFTRYVIGRENNVVRVDFQRKPDPPAQKFPGAGALRKDALQLIDAVPPTLIQADVA